MGTWINVEPKAVLAPQTQTIRGVEVKVFVAPHNIPQAVRGEVDQASKTFIIYFRYLDEDKSECAEQHSPDGVVRIFLSSSSHRVDHIIVDTQRAKASEVKLNFNVVVPANRPIDKAENFLETLTSKESTLSRKLNYEAVREAIESSKEQLLDASV